MRIYTLKYHGNIPIPLFSNTVSQNLKMNLPVKEKPKKCFPHTGVWYMREFGMGKIKICTKCCKTLELI